MIRVRMAVLLLLPVLAATAGCGLLSSAVNDFAVSATTKSMEPTIKSGTRLSMRRTGDDYVPRLGDVVVFEAPDGWTDSQSEALRLSRVIGLPGSTVMCCDAQGRLQVNGKALHEPYIAAPPASHLRFEVRVPSGRLWVMGDNRHIALDSRAHRADPGEGTIAVSDVSGVMIPPKR
ncbi:signal peptidase I [Nonomuraea sp. NPDC046802]|uniref:signal peptidase I n=1 Tax=Nonomuraea sp. NPDC046802 TaxID=3154919 RepID=UPI0033EAC035